MARGNAWNPRRTQSLPEFDDDSTAQPPRLSGSIGRLNFVCRPVAAPIVGKFSLEDDDMQTNTDLNASSSTVAGPRGDIDISAIELGLYGPRPVSVVEDFKT